jgi:hypothetical protein
MLVNIAIYQCRKTRHNMKNQSYFTDKFHGIKNLVFLELNFYVSKLWAWHSFVKSLGQKDKYLRQVAAVWGEVSTKLVKGWLMLGFLVMLKIS